MLLTISKRSTFILLLFSAVSVTFFSCQKDFSYELGDLTVTVPSDLKTKVSTSVSGFVTDENNAPVLGATVLAGTSSTTTDKYGYFQIANVQLVKNAAVVTVNKSGYYKGIKTFAATAGKAGFFRIKLIPKTIAGSFIATTGGDVSLINGMKVTLPANGVVDATTGAAYAGTVNVAAFWIDPKSPELNQIMPGDLRGLNGDQQLKSLTSFGMAAVELTGTAGEMLQVAPGKEATLTMPIPSSILASAPATIPLWYFNETNGLWKQEGTATKTGNYYKGNVKHFSFWNCDVPANYVHFDCTILDANGHPVPYARVRISKTDTTYWNSARDGYTDSSGYVAGLIPDNASLKLEVFTNYTCSAPVYTQTFTTANASVSLGNITLPATSLATVTGTITDCNGAPVTNGYVLMQKGYYYDHYPVDASGSFSFTTTICGSSNQVILTGVDLSTMLESTSSNLTLVNGTNPAGNFIACGTSVIKFINYSINGVNYSYTTPNWQILGWSSNTTSGFYTTNASGGTSGPITFSFTNTNLALNSVQTLISFNATQITDSIVSGIPPSPVNITELGPIGTYWAGNFITTLLGNSGTSYNVICHFRAKRSF